MKLLDKICEMSRADLEKLKELEPLDSIADRAMSFEKQHANFGTALLDGKLRNKAGISVIAEMKKSSPSEGVIRESFNPIDIAKDYESAGASAISVLTEKYFFGGNLERLANVSANISIPTLRKDFIFDEYQLYEARLSGASAVLIIARILDEKSICRLIQISKMLSLDTLCEAHTPDEASLLYDCGAKIIGANCRNLETLKIDFSATESIFKRIPTNIVKIHESGVKNALDLRAAKDAGADAALVGTTLMRAKSPALALKNLLG